MLRNLILTKENSHYASVVQLAQSNGYLTILKWNPQGNANFSEMPSLKPNQGNNWADAYPSFEVDTINVDNTYKLTRQKIEKITLQKSSSLCSISLKYTSLIVPV